MIEIISDYKLNDRFSINYYS